MTGATIVALVTWVAAVAERLLGRRRGAGENAEAGPRGRTDRRA